MNKVILRALSVFLATAMLTTLLASCVTGGSGTDISADQNPPATTTDKNGGTPVMPDIPAAMYESDPKLAVTEVMVGNRFTVAAPDGEYRPWFEFYAREDTNLSEYTIKYGEHEEWRLPAVSLRGGEYYLLFAGGDGFPYEISPAANVTIFHGELVSQNFIYINRSENCSFIVNAGCETTTPTPMYSEARDPDMLVITEIMSDNTRFPIDGMTNDWIEIYNAGKTDILLSDYYASDKQSDPYITRLPEKILHSGEYTVFLCGVDLDFNLSKTGDNVLLTRKDGVVSSFVAFNEIGKNCTYTPDGISEFPSPGYPNGYDGMIDYICSRSGLLISEVMSSNTMFYKKNNDYFDMVELYNSTDKEINLAEYFITDKPSDLTKVRLPEVTLAPGDYYALYCTDDIDLSISKDGENLLISREDGYIVDSISVPSLMHDISYGRYNGDLVYFELPSMGKVNTKGYRYISESPVASVTSGVFSDAVTLTLDGDGDIYYTTDGSKPTTKSRKYNGETITFSEVGALRMICKKGEQIASPETLYTYFVNIPEYDLPVVTVNLDNELIFGEKGVWTTQKKTEVEAHVSYYKEGNEQFSVGCGIKLFGNDNVRRPKKSIQLKFKAKYGCSKLDYDVFEDGEITEFDSLVIRSGSQAVWRCLVNDEFVSSFIRKSGNMPSLLTQRYKHVNFYINGRYMGIYSFREKIDEDFISAHTGYSPESISVVYRMQTSERGPDCNDLYTWLNFADQNDMRVKENYEIIKEHFDVENIVDFFLNAIWCGNIDTLNMRMYRSSDGDGRWRFLMYDLDRAFYYSYASANLYLGSYNLKSRPYNGLIYKLLQNTEFNDLFYERLNFHVNNTFVPELALAHFEYIISLVDHDMPYEVERWKVDDPSHPQTYQKWVSNCNTLKSRLTQAYIDRMIELINTNVQAILKDKSVNKQK